MTNGDSGQHQARCEITDDVAQAAAKLRAGGLVAFPTETVYGLGAHALSEESVARIFSAKRRPKFDPLIVHVARREQLDSLVAEFPETARILADKFWPGPLTLVLPKRAIVPDLVTAGLPTVAVRIPSHSIAQELLRQVGIPVAAPSANRFSQVSPTTAAHVQKQLANDIDLILDGGPCEVGVESTVIQIAPNGTVALLRPGGTTIEDIEAVLNQPVAIPPLQPIAVSNNRPATTSDAPKQLKGTSIEIPPADRAGSHSQHATPSNSVGSDPKTDKPAFPAPGMLLQHYAPRTPLYLHADRTALLSTLDDLDSKSVGLLVFDSIDRPITLSSQGHWAIVEVLSQSSNLTEAATNLFAALRRLDASGVSVIHAERVPDHDLGRAINDRLTRASAR